MVEQVEDVVEPEVLDSALTLPIDDEAEVFSPALQLKLAWKPVAGCRHILIKNMSMEVKLPYDPVCLSVGGLVGWAGRHMTGRFTFMLL